MTTSTQQSPHHEDVPPLDPWQAISYMLSGVIVYGLAGYGLDVWLGTTFLVGVGIVVGCGLGLLVLWRRWGRPPEDFVPHRTPQSSRTTTTSEQETP